MRVFAFGDVHGRPKTLKRLFTKAGVRSGHKVFGLGDYFDRGPDTKGALDYLIDARDRGVDLKCLVGNHDGFWIAAYNMYNILPKGMLRFGDSPRFNDIVEWLSSISKKPSLASYGIDPDNYNLTDLSAFPDLHIDFMSGLESHALLEIGGKKYLFVHAGLPAEALMLPTVEDALSWTLANRPYEMIWGKTGLERVPSFNNATIVHGHIPWKFVDHIVNGRSEVCLRNRWKFRLPGCNYGKINLDASIDSDGKNYLAGMWFPEEEPVVVEGDD